MLDPPSKSLVAVIDDDAAFAGSLAALLHSDGYSTELFGSAERFLAKESGRCYGCLLIDWVLPGMSGTSLCRHLASRPEHPPMILMSGASPDIETLRAQLAMDIPFLQKPFDPERLLAVLPQLCRRHYQPVGSGR